MKIEQVTLITNLMYEQVPRVSGRDYVEYLVHGGALQRASCVSSTGEVLFTDDVVHRQILPINELHYLDGRSDLYVAYTEEVERLLGVPIRALNTRCDIAERSAADNATKFNTLLDTAMELANLGWLDRLRFLFKRYRLKHQPPRGVKL